MLLELIELHLASVPKLLSEIEDALGSSDYHAVRTRAHTLKGSLGVLCAQKSHDAAIALERLATTQDDSACRQQFADLSEELEALEHALARKVSQ